MMPRSVLYPGRSQYKDYDGSWWASRKSSFQPITRSHAHSVGKGNAAWLFMTYKQHKENITEHKLAEPPPLRDPEKNPKEEMTLKPWACFDSSALYKKTLLKSLYESVLGRRASSYSLAHSPGISKKPLRARVSKSLTRRFLFGRALKVPGIDRNHFPSFLSFFPFYGVGARLRFAVDKRGVTNTSLLV